MTAGAPLHIGTPSAAASGVVLPIAAASSGKLVCPSRTVQKARSLAFWTAAADVSPYALVTALVSAMASSVVATPAACSARPRVESRAQRVTVTVRFSAVCNAPSPATARST